jgi:two-component system LytT family sensor kinase
MSHKEKLFSDKWIWIIGIPLVGISFPFIFGLRFGDPKFYGWIFISTFTTLVSWFATRLSVSLLWDRFSWESNPFVHILVELGLLMVFSMVTISLIYFMNKLLLHPQGNYWQDMRPIRTGIFIVYGILLLLHEAVHLFFKWKKELTHAADLEKENIRSKFEALKNHVNPHFLFNSLGTLSSLIRSDPEKAEKYVNEFAGIYRYFLEVNNNELVTVAEELDFIRSYMFLQQIRFGDGFTFLNRVDGKNMEALMLPLTLELLVENALKHNTTLSSSPLSIEIYTRDHTEWLVVQNTFQPRPVIETTGTGLQNLEQRYMSYLGKGIRYGREGNFFRVEIPLIHAAP